MTVSKEPSVVWTRTKIAGVAVAAAVSLAGTWVGLAQKPGSPDQRTLDASCQEATNGCEVCRIEAGGRSQCSLPGIACQPSGWRCIKTQAPPSDSPRSERPDTR